jgi:hypothetical protein
VAHEYAEYTDEPRISKAVFIRALRVFRVLLRSFFEMVFSQLTQRADPIFRQALERRVCRNAGFRISRCRIINVAACSALIFTHEILLGPMMLTQIQLEMKNFCQLFRAASVSERMSVP